MKEYERLTKKGAYYDKDDYKLDLVIELDERHYEKVNDIETICRKLNRLAELEDKIENGTLIELPCKVGDKLYTLCCKGYNYGGWYIKETCVSEINLFPNGINVIEKQVDERGICFYYKIDLSLFNKVIFLTKAEAEAKLKEQQNER
jgi:hypothetical protein